MNVHSRLIKKKAKKHGQPDCLPAGEQVNGEYDRTVEYLALGPERESWERSTGIRGPRKQTPELQKPDTKG